MSTRLVLLFPLVAVQGACAMPSPGAPGGPDPSTPTTRWIERILTSSPVLPGSCFS